MSTSPGTWPSRSLSSKPRALHRAQAGRLFLVGFPLFFVLFVSAAPLFDGIVEIAGLVGSRRSERAALEPLIAKAEAASATWETAKPGDYVLWVVTRTGENAGWVAGRPLYFSSPPDHMALPWARSGAEILAVVEARRPDGLVLRYLGRP